MKYIAITATFLLTASIVLVIFNKASGCELSWIRYADRCYRIFQSYVHKVKASTTCMWKEKGDLADISDASILDFLSEHVSHNSQSMFWVKSPETATGNHYLWLEPTNKTWWQYPKGWAFSPTGCFAFNGTIVAEEDCNEGHGYICERKASNMTSRIGCYDENFELPWTGRKYSFVGEVTGSCLFSDVDYAKKKYVVNWCQNYNAHFADFDEILAEGVTAFHEHQVFSNDGHRYWTNFTWNGTNLIRSNGEVLPEDYPVPVVKMDKGFGTCITVQFNFEGIFLPKFYQTDCNANAFIICSSDSERKGTVSKTTSVGEYRCPSGWQTEMKFSYFCYLETSSEERSFWRSWDDAENYCKAYEGHLASFHSREEIEKIHFSTKHGYDHWRRPDLWIGLYFDVDSETYRWSDGSPLDYEKWAPEEPNHRNKTHKCVMMNPEDKLWRSALCGIIKKFVCKSPKTSRNPKPIYRLDPTPLQRCGLHSDKAYFEGYCYWESIFDPVNWHEAKELCGKYSAHLVSIHSAEEIGFLLRLIRVNSYSPYSLFFRYAYWIGLHADDDNGNLSWTDGTAVDFTYFDNNGEYNSFQWHKCGIMDMDEMSNTGMYKWKTSNCYDKYSFLCKEAYNITTTNPTTQDPTTTRNLGNCKRGWIPHLDRCYYIGGKEEKNRKNWAEAVDFCEKNNGYLTTIRNVRDQKFLAYLLQTIGEDAWIGLHLFNQSQRQSYHWIDDMEMQYYNWAHEAEVIESKKDCVKIVYYDYESGVWKDDDCHLRLGFICQDSKDPDLPPAPSDPDLNCVYPEEWLKLDSMCFKMFAENPLTFHEAELACKKENASLASISDPRIKAFVTYLAEEISEPFFVGLIYNKDRQNFRWPFKDPNFPRIPIYWDKNEPSQLSKDTCIASTSKGYLKTSSCDEKMPYLCQITTNILRKPENVVGECPSTSSLWKSGSSSYCYMMDYEKRLTWYQAHSYCHRYDSQHLSLHSMEEVHDVEKLIKPGVESVFIGLRRNKKGGFKWSDGSSVNFESWDKGEPSKSQNKCVEMTTDNMKWKVTSCMNLKYFICKRSKVSELQSSSTTGIFAVIFSILMIAALIVVVAFFRKRIYSLAQLKRKDKDSSSSFKKATYDACSSSMKFNKEDKN